MATVFNSYFDTKMDSCRRDGHVVAMFAARALIFLMFLSAATAHADLTLTFGGDVNFNKTLQNPAGDGVRVRGRAYRFEQLTADLRPLVDGDVNFANIETVVTSQTALPPQDKAFVFRSHPNSILHLVDLGFNLFGLANNHSYNHGFAGLEETLSTFEGLARSAPRAIAFSGIERTREDFGRARILRVGAHTIAFAAIGIMDSQFRVGSAPRAGVLNVKNQADYDLVLKSLREAVADLKILSVHMGIEMKTSLETGQRSMLERALSEGDVDLVLGHHPHVVRPVQSIQGKAIFYSLGNYLMVGSANITGRGIETDYGLFGRAHFAWDAVSRRLKLQAVEAIPLTDTHLQPKPHGAQAAEARIQALNSLSTRELGSAAMRFRISAMGSGVFCNPQSLAYSVRAKAVCGEGR